MSSPTTFRIKEGESQIKKLIKASVPMIGKRLHALLVFKRNEASGISKRVVADEIGVNHNSVQTWRTLYIKEGIEGLLSHDKTGYKPSKITKKQEKALQMKLSDESNGIVGFNELLAWFDKKFKTETNYKTFHGYVVRKFNAKIKVARKSHVKKNPAAVEDFKKTSKRHARKLSPKTRIIIKA